MQENTLIYLLLLHRVIAGVMVMSSGESSRISMTVGYERKLFRIEKH